MRLRIALLLVVALTVAGCATPEVSDGIEMSDGSGQVANDEASQSATSPPASDEPVSPEEANVDTNQSDSIVEEDETQETEDGDGAAPPLVTSTTVQKSTPSSSTTAPAADGSTSVVTAKNDLANRLDIAADSIEVVSIQEVDWPDASIGCPQPDMVYAQVVTNGSRIILSHDGVSYSYHAAAMGDPFYCENPVDPVPGAET